MKALSWFGALVLFVAVAAGTVSVLRLHSNTPRAIASTGDLASAAEPASVPPSPSNKPQPSAKPAKPPVKKAAAPARPAATSSIVVGSTQQALINQDRVRNGLRPLTWSSCLASIAYSNAARISHQGTNITHTNGPARDLGCGLGYHAGENIGWYSAGINDTWANNAFMASPEHRANILSPYYHYVATSWVRGANGYGYIAVEFS
jgi:uncharacterized protein YkwD